MAKRKKPAARKSRPGRLRIVAGNWRSRLLPVVEQEGLRPTSERIRETLFNWLSEELPGKHCLDLFAGTGALGFEALSRGAGSATLIEKSPPAVTGLHASAELLDAKNIRIVRTSALKFLSRPASSRFDIVFLDPPFSMSVLEECCKLLHSNGWLTDDAVVYLEQDKNQTLPELPEGWRVAK
jgi:16S rRNA (guanine966-N2)-methyltransferase